MPVPGTYWTTKRAKQHIKHKISNIKLQGKRKKRRDSNTNMRKKNLQRKKARSDDMARLEPATGENRQWTVYHIFTLGRYLVLFFSFLSRKKRRDSNSNMRKKNLQRQKARSDDMVRLEPATGENRQWTVYHIFTLGRYLVLFSSLLCSPLSLLSYPILSYPILDLAHRRADYRFRFYMFLVEALIASAVIYTWPIACPPETTSTKHSTICLTK